MIRLAYFTHPSSLRHEMGEGHPEAPERVDRIDERLRISGIMDLLDPCEAGKVTREQLERAHDPHYLDAIQSQAPAEGYFQVDGDTAMNVHTLEAAAHAAGAGVAAVDTVLAGTHDRAFCNVRPPGHHAMRGQAMGFCFYSNVAISALHALSTGKVERVAVFDFDVHHGNGTEDILAGNPGVRMLSTFQSPLYPYCGERPLADNIISATLPAYSGGDAMRKAVEDQWAPAVEIFQPELVLISAGFDAHRSDDLAQLGWTDADFAWITRRIVAFARRHAQGRIVSMLEGGYEVMALSRSVEQHIRELLEVNPES